LLTQPAITFINLLIIEQQQKQIHKYTGITRLHAGRSMEKKQVIWVPVINVWTADTTQTQRKQLKTMLQVHWLSVWQQTS